MPSLCTAATRAEADLAQEPSPGLRELFECKEGSCLGMGQPHHLWATSSRVVAAASHVVNIHQRPSLSKTFHGPIPIINKNHFCSRAPMPEGHVHTKKNKSGRSRPKTRWADKTARRVAPSGCRGGIAQTDHSHLPNTQPPFKSWERIGWDFRGLPGSHPRAII